MIATNSPTAGASPGAYAQLGPGVLLEALDTVGLRGDGRILQLNSYENRVFRVMLEDGDTVVAKCYRPGRWSDAQIDEEHCFTRELAAAEVPVRPPLPLKLVGLSDADPSDAVPQQAVPAAVAAGTAATHGAAGHAGHTGHTGHADASGRPGPWLTGADGTLLHWPLPGGEAHRIAVSRWLGGRDPDIESPAAFQRLGRLIGRVHAAGVAAGVAAGAATRSAAPEALESAAAGHSPAAGLFAHRLTLSPALGVAAVDTLLALGVVDAGLRSRWETTARRAMDAVARAFDAWGGTPLLRLHGDAHRGNLLERDQTLHLVDFDDACNGPAMQDLWLFLDGHEGEERQRQLRALLGGYEDFMDFDDAQLGLIEPLRTLRILRHSAWIAQRWTDPAFPIAFPTFGAPNHWADQITVLDEQVDRMGHRAAF